MFVPWGLTTFILFWTEDSKYGQTQQGKQLFIFCLFVCILQQGLTWPRLALSSTGNEVGLEFHISASTFWCDHRGAKESKPYTETPKEA